MRRSPTLCTPTHRLSRRGRPRGPPPAAAPTGPRTPPLHALSARSPRSVEKVAALSGLAADRVRAELGLLSLDGAVRERAGGWVRAS